MMKKKTRRDIDVLFFLFQQPECAAIYCPDCDLPLSLRWAAYILLDAVDECPKEDRHECPTHANRGNLIFLANSCPPIRPPGQGGVPPCGSGQGPAEVCMSMECGICQGPKPGVR